MKFIHAADIHLDSPLHGLSAYGDAPVEEIRTASRRAFANLIDQAIEQEVDFMVIAGDLYDGPWKDYNTGFYFSSQMGRLREAGIPVYLLFGNHDAESEMTKKLSLPDNVHVFPANKAGTFNLDSLKVTLHGRSFKEIAVTENLVPGYPDPKPGWLNIGVLHTALEGGTVHADYAPCSLNELIVKGYDYWALGHVHIHKILHADPCWVVYPGNIQGRNIRETGPKGAVLVVGDDSKITSVTQLTVDVARWYRLEIDASPAKNLTDVVQLTGEALEKLFKRESAVDLLAVRVTIIGKTEAHGELFGKELHLRSEVLNQALIIGAGRIWIEKVALESEPPLTTQQILDRKDAVADLQSYLSAAAQDSQLLGDLHEDLQLLVSRAPIDVRNAIGETAHTSSADMAALVASIAPDLIARIIKAE